MEGKGWVGEEEHTQSTNGDRFTGLGPAPCARWEEDRLDPTRAGTWGEGALLSCPQQNPPVDPSREEAG